MPDRDDTSSRIPIIEESVTIDKVRVQTDAVRVETSVEKRDVVVEDTIRREVLNIKRIAMDQRVDVAPPPREDGETTIISVVEERAVVVKQLFVIEEVHVTREQTQAAVAIPVTLRKTVARVDRPAVSAATEGTADDQA